MQNKKEPKHNAKAALQSELYSSCCSMNPTHPLSSPDHGSLGLFSSFKMTHIFLHCAPLLLHHFLSLGLCQKVPLHMVARFPVGHWKSTVLTYKAQKTMLDSSKQTRTCTSDCHGLLLHRTCTRLIWAADRTTTSPAFALLIVRWMKVPSWGVFEASL